MNFIAPPVFSCEFLANIPFYIGNFVENFFFTKKNCGASFLWRLFFFFFSFSFFASL